MRGELLIKRVRLVDALGERGPVDLLIGEGRILSLEGGEAKEAVEGEGLYALPGFLDLHAHLREPGQEEKEDLASGLKAALRGGYTDLVSMPNTSPPIDTPEAVAGLRKKAEALNLARLHVGAALTVGQEGKRLCELGLLAQAGARLFTDDGRTNEDAGVLALGLIQAGALGVPVAVHAEDAGLRGEGVMNGGPLADALGLPGNPPEAEAARVARDLEVLRYALKRSPRARLHIQHVSSKLALAHLRRGQAEGLPVTGEATPHHLTLTEEALRGLDPLYKVAPPLRTREDQEALMEALLDGTLVAVATDHAPHTLAEKEKDLLRAPFGIPSLEVAFPLLYTELHLKRGFPLPTLVARFTDGPRAVLGLPPLHLVEGAEASLILIDPKGERPVDPGRFASKARYSPWAGWALRGWPVLTLVAGEVRYRGLE